MRMRWLPVLLLGLLFAAGSVAAQDFNPPGLDRDSNAYLGSLTARYPAGGTPEARQAAEARAEAARAAGDWAGVAAGLEARVALGEDSAAQWLALARAQLRRTPPEPKRALEAAWQAFGKSDAGRPEIAPLLVLAQAFTALGQHAEAAQALEQVVLRDPGNADDKRLLAEARRAAGMQVRRLTTEAEANPPRACIRFTVPPAKSILPQDWVRLEPPRPEAAVTREGDQLCVSGLPSGETTKIILRAGLPGEQELALAKAATLTVAMPNRRPSIGFDTRLFVLPRFQAQAVTLTTVNLSAVSLKLIRLSDRSIPALLRDSRMGQPMDAWNAEYLADSVGSTVWQGKAEIPNWQPNRPARTALPVPPPLTTAGPGLYALVAEAGDGTRNVSGAVQVILRTDLAPTFWRGADGLTVQVRGYSDAKPRAGVALKLLARNNDLLAQATTDENGVARFAAPLLAGQGSLAAASIQALAPKAADGSQDFATLDLNVAAFDLSDRGVSGMPHPGPLDAYVWLDRGIYRPGETVRVMALLRDAAGLPADIPARITVKRPNGQVFLRATPPRSGDASLYLPVTLSAGAAAGTWTVEVAADPSAPPIGTAQFRVDAFVPDRMAVDFGALPPVVAAGTPTDIPVTARYLYGAPGADLSGKASLRLLRDPDPFPALAGYRVGIQGESYAPVSRDLDLPQTDAKGRTTLKLDLGQLPDVTFALKAELDVAVNDPSGHASRATTSLKVRPANPLLGIKPAFADDAVDQGAAAGFTLRAVAPDGQPMAMTAKLRLVREKPDWRLVMRGKLARYEVVWRDEPLETRTVQLPPDGLAETFPKLDFGRYRLEIAQAGGMAVATYRFRVGWASSDNPDVPDRVDVSADRRSVPAGQNVRIHIASPFAGHATLLVLTNKVLSLKDIDVAEGGTDVEVPVTTAWGPGAYVAVHVFRGVDDAKKQRPARAIGLTWVGVDPAARTLDVAIGTPDKAAPRAPLVVPVRAAPGAWVTLAAVDEGILRLTRFASPDPRPHFLGRRRLGIDLRDDWGRLIPPAEGGATLLRQGGDEGSFALPDIPQRTVTLFTPPVQAGPDGTARITLDIPDFNGQVRLMAVAWAGSRLGAANTDMTIRDPLVAEPLLPRFLAPGDEARLAVLLHNLDLPKGEARAVVTTSGPLEVIGDNRLLADLAPGQQGLPATKLRATGAGRGVIHLAITGPGGFHLTRDTAITIRPARGRVALVAGQELAPGATARLTPGLDRFLAGTGSATATFGAPVRYDTAALVQSLADYPLSCLEQAASRGFPLAFLPDGPAAGPGRAARLQQAVASVLDRQRYDGGFALWTANGEAEPWLSAYALEFLLRARRGGATVPQQALDDAIKFIGEAADGDSNDPPFLAAQAYRLYVLALAGHGRPGAARVLATRLDRLPTPLAKAQLAAALALAHDTPRAEAAFTAALDAPARDWWAFDYGTALRDQAAIVVLLKESGLLPDRLAALVARLPGADLRPESISTQEEAWAAAAAATLGRGAKPASIAVDGGVHLTAPTITLALAKPTDVRNQGSAAVWQSVAATGVPAQPLPAARQGMRVSRQFLNLDGSPVNLDDLHQNTVFILLMEGRAEDGQAHRAMLLQGLPAGWELAGRLNAGEVPGMKFLGTLSEPEAQPAADDRFAAVLDLTPRKPDFRVAVRVRAVTPGSYELPGAELSDMYRPGVFARQNTGRITVLPP